jgi:hypothetical protein
MAEIMAGLRARGVALAEVEPAAWHRAAADLAGAAPEVAAACLALCRALPNREAFERHRTLDLFQATGVTFDCTRARAALAGSGIAFPPPGAELLPVYLDGILGPEAPGAG